MALSEDNAHMDSPTEKYPLRGIGVYAPETEVLPAKKPNKKTKAAEWKTVWYDFSQSTTLHGVNKITDETPYTLRRIIWLMIVCLGIALFINQLLTSILYFLDYPITVTVAINHNDSLTFPAVSICNQNDFRMTATAGAGLYNLVQDYYLLLGTGTFANLSFYGAQNTTLDNFYYATAHKIEDMIRDCTWDEQPCGLQDFQTQLTDYGVCFTFNSGLDGSKMRKVSRTGADQGLRLSLNIEQYEYMVGPNPGAGIKLLVHENLEVPMVRDLGVAIPPGTHAYVGVSIVELLNLPPPHGECDQFATLDYYDVYSMAACTVESKEEYMVGKCDCRDVYMPESPDREGFPPICTLEKYQTCAVPAMEMFYNDTERQECPIPCFRSLYDTTISYAYSSTFDAELFLNLDNITALTMDYVKAREVSQRVLEHVVEADVELVHRLSTTIADMDDTLNRTAVNIELSLQLLHGVMDELMKRVWFHNRWGLDQLIYTVEYNFVRGWTVYEERTLSLVTFGYQEVGAYIEAVLNDVINLPEDDDVMRTALYVSSMKEILRIKILCERALDNLTAINAGYTVPEALNTYTVTPDKHFDLAYITDELIIYSSDYWDRTPSYNEMFQRRTGEFLEAAENMEVQIQRILTGEAINITEFQIWRAAFEKAARSYNYYWNIYNLRIVNAPTVYADGLSDAFHKSNETLGEAYIDLLRSIESTRSFLQEVTVAWEDIRSAKNSYRAYLNHPNMTKSELAKLFNSVGIINSVNTLTMFFGEITTRSLDAVDKLHSFQYACEDIWRMMLETTSLFPFYEMVQDDVTGGETAELLEIFAEMLEESESWVSDHWQELDVLMNADFVGSNVSERVQEASEIMQPAEEYLDIGQIIGHLDEQFFSIINEIQTTLQEFLDNNIVGVDFYKNNIMHVDVFMRELSYERIEQQEAYGTTSLWSDIGGSMGLFIGASVITGFELVDVIVHNLFRLHCARGSTS